MSENTPEYEQWKIEMKKALDDLVARDFEKLYLSHDSDRLNVWGEIASNLYDLYGLTDIKTDDSEYKLKRKKEHCISVNMEIYIMEEFPWELDNARTYRFVKQYEKLPKQAPDEWDKFELDKKMEERRKSIESDSRVMFALHQFRLEQGCCGYK